jgi:hypothetical protein
MKSGSVQSKRRDNAGARLTEGGSGAVLRL